MREGSAAEIARVKGAARASRIRHHGEQMHPATVRPRASAARLAVSVLFFANGAASASILPRLPAIKTGLALSNAELGAAVAAMPLGGLIAGGLVGILIARFGSGRVAVVAGVLDMLALAALGLAPSWAALVGAYFTMGIFDATMDASMNTHGIAVERRYRRSIMQGFHGGWSLGCMAAGAVGAVAAAAAVPVSVHLAVVALLLIGAIAVTARGLLPRTEADLHAADDGVPDLAIHPRNVPRLLWVLLPVAMLGILCAVAQASAATWSTVYATDVLGLSAGLAAGGYVLYAGAMTLGRFTNDRWVDRLGPTRLVRIGAVISLAALFAIMAAAPLQAPLLAFAGFALIGIGTSPMFPVMVVTAGSRPGIPAGYGVALVSWLVRFGLVLAPALIGPVADVVGLAAAMWIPVVAAVAIWSLAPTMTGTAVEQVPARPRAA
jgi:fucose permease